MNFGRVVSSAYSWISLKKVFWFLVFFWVSLPVLLILPDMIKGQIIFSRITIPVVCILYAFLYFLVLLGVVLLTKNCLWSKSIRAKPLSVTRFIDLIFLVFVEMFYIFVWSLHRPFREIQLLLIAALAVTFYYSVVVGGSLAVLLLAICFIMYLVLVVFNAVRGFFSTTVFINADVSLRAAVRGSWAITHRRTLETLGFVCISVLLALVCFLFILFALGAIVSIVLNFFFISVVSIEIGFRVAALFALGPALIVYQYSIAEVYAQLVSKKEVSSSVKRLLAHRVLHPRAKFSHHKAKARHPARKLAKKRRR